MSLIWPLPWSLCFSRWHVCRTSVAGSDDVAMALLPCQEQAHNHTTSGGGGGNGGGGGGGVGVWHSCVVVEEDIETPQTTSTFALWTAPWNYFSFSFFFLWRMVSLSSDDNGVFNSFLFSAMLCPLFLFLFPPDTLLFGFWLESIVIHRSNWKCGYRCVCLFKQFKHNSKTYRMNAVCSVLECALHSSGVLCLLFLLYVFFRLRTD